MLASAVTNCGYVLLQLLLLAPSALQSNSISLQPELPPPPKYLNNLIEDVIKERPAETLLLLKRQLDVNCSMEELNAIEVPIIRLDEFVMIMSIYSIIMTCLFNANLSTLLTMPLEKDYISNLEELRESGLPILFDNIFDIAVKNDIRRGFVNLSLDQTFFIDNDERLQMIQARNLQNVYFMNNEAWSTFDKLLTNDKSHVFCSPSALHFYKDMSLHGVLGYNSIYLNALNHFILRVQENGMKQHWVSESYEKMLKYMNHSQKIFYPNPLTYRDLQWVWELLGICYAVSILVFIGELCMKYWQRRHRERHVIIV
ncbi:uncharacterized protein LOC133836779 [Drosophila sulfurigaster albostrigata]|uniref:uncharacterized protein LOC133836779 n=1 Tax=Drosophila sulfurigaster albostrigata TaxID=89887 RepID=UPI002D21C92F|nr:uncharacterized protein LOC133836779 [Drosophila sulfurigaster albostrigata]